MWVEIISGLQTEKRCQLWSLLAWFLPEFAYMSMLFIVEMVCTADSGMNTCHLGSRVYMKGFARDSQTVPTTSPFLVKYKYIFLCRFGSVIPNGWSNTVLSTGMDLSLMGAEIITNGKIGGALQVWPDIDGYDTGNPQSTFALCHLTFALWLLTGRDGMLKELIIRIGLSAVSLLIWQKSCEFPGSRDLTIMRLYGMRSIAHDNEILFAFKHIISCDFLFISLRWCPV